MSLSVAAFGGASPAVAASPGFIVFDGLLYIGKPDLRSRGLTPIAGTGDLWGGGVSRADVDEARIAAIFSPYRNSNGFFYLDIETWPLMQVTPDVRSQNEKKLEQMIDVAHRTAPAMHIGFYALLPGRVYWPLMGRDASYQAWRTVNQALEPLAKHVDAVFPSLYTFYSDVGGWKSYARQTLIEARRYGKPVYAFLWPQFHESDPALAGKEIPADYWLAELELCAEFADGVVLWGGYQMTWDENAVWWRATQAFIRAKRIAPLSGGE